MAPDPEDASSARRNVTVLLLSAAISLLVVIQVNRTDRHLELRELLWWQVAAVAVGVLGSGAAVYLASQYGPWSWITSVRRYGRDVAIAHVSLAVIVVLYLVSMMFR